MIAIISEFPTFSPALLFNLSIKSRPDPKVPNKRKIASTETLCRMAVQWDLKLWRAVTQNNAVLLRGLLQKPEVKKVIAGKSEWVFMRDPIHAAAFQGKIHMLEEFKV